MKADRDKIRMAMARACMTVKDLENASDTQRQTIHRILRECSTRPATIGRIAKALGVDVSEIVKEVR